MLNTDICLAFDIHDDEGDCCTYVEGDLFTKVGQLVEFCGKPYKNDGKMMPPFKEQCCRDQKVACDNPEKPNGPAFEAVVEYA
jgi:hypothetical protein